ncbi:MAG TPA: GEVED domain-containing protein, partial [Saprospiraceae bacterium]|nr:GEVED domain-containing protein [Saprospiraceae bacterium]
DPNNPNILYGGYNQLWKTENRGDSWTQISSISKAGRVRSIAAAPSDSRYLYIADYQQIFKSTNGGEEWNDITGSLPTSSGTLEYIAVKYDDPNTLWVVLSGYSTPGVYESTDGGLSWNNISTGLPPIPAYSMVQNYQATNDVELYLGTELGVYYKKGSNDWVPYNTGLPNVRTGEIEIYYSSNPGETRLRAASYGRGLWETPIEYEPTPMIFVSSTTIQKELSSVSPNQPNQEILKVELVTNGNLSPFHATSFTFNTSGSTNPGTDITNAKLYYTATSTAFSTSNQFGETIISPDGEFIITGNQELGNGRNNFWLTYDIPADAVIGNQVDAQCTSVVLDEPKTLLVSDPPGARVIAFDYCDAGAAELTYEYISRVTIGAIDNPSGKDPGGYTDFTSQVVDLNRGSSIDIFVENGVPYFADEVLVYMDWNIDGDFDDAGEVVFHSDPSGAMVFEGSFRAPLTAKIGITRMRVRLHDSQNGPLSEACGFSQWGEVEDYSVRISAWDPCAALNYLDYKASSIPGDYVSLGNEGTVIATADFDNSNSDPQDIGFSFKYNCEFFSQFVLNTNGFIKLGNTPPSSAALFFEDPRVASGGIFENNHPDDVNILSPMNIDLGPGTGTPEYRVHTSGVAPNRICTIQYKDVREAGSNPVPQFDNMQFQIKLYESTNVIEFVYGDWTPSGNQNDLRPVACGLKGSDSRDDQLLIVSKYNDQAWDDVFFSNSNDAFPPAIFYQEPPQSPKPDAGRTFRFNPRYNNDLGIYEIYSLGDASLYYSNPQPIAVNVVNAGKTLLTDIPVAMQVTGDNFYVESVIIPSLAPDESIIVSFPDLVATNVGNSNIYVHVVNDQDEDSSNNELTWEQNTNEFNCNYSSTHGPAEQRSFTPQADRIYAAKYPVSGTASVAAITAYITDDVNNIGKTVFGVILHGDGSIAGQSETYVIAAEDLGTWHNFDIITPPVFTDDAFYAGLAMEGSSPGNSPLGIQDENPARPDTYFESALDGSGLIELGQPYRLMVGALLAPTAPSAGFISGDQVICRGLSVSLGIQEYSGFIQWQESPDGLTNWVNVSGGSGSNSASYITSSLNVTTYYRVEVTQPTFAPVYSSVTSVEVLPLPGVAGPITGDEFICQEQGDVLYVVEEIANATSYVWSLPFGATGSSNTNSILVNFGTSSSGGEISVAGANDLCVGESSSLFVVSLEEHSPQVVEVIQPTCTVPTGSASIFDLPDYGWTLTLLPDGFIVIGLGFNFTFENLSPGTYQFSVEDEFGCLSIVTPEFTIDPQPAIPPTPLISAIDNILHSDSPSGNQWYDANGPIPGATGQDYVALVDGNYYVIVTLEGCESSPSNSINIIISSTEVVDEKMKAFVYPNPVSGQLILELRGNINPVPYEIHDAFGVLVLKGEVATKSFVNTKELVPGVYFIQIGKTGEASIRKFVKE